LQAQAHRGWGAAFKLTRIWRVSCNPYGLYRLQDTPVSPPAPSPAAAADG
jgi:hypothetical protein